jgi:hypothetical protein
VFAGTRTCMLSMPDVVALCRVATEHDCDATRQDVGVLITCSEPDAKCKTVSQTLFPTPHAFSWIQSHPTIVWVLSGLLEGARLGLAIGFIVGLGGVPNQHTHALVCLVNSRMHRCMQCL